MKVSPNRGMFRPNRSSQTQSKGQRSREKTSFHPLGFSSLTTDPWNPYRIVAN